ncbi:MAG TPA: N-6 DNA methylase [Candidatus Lokiarchaeia archaeon]|nr:N-6 DNA methylase [Candidatus Lokiarchaeia archaeon]
MPDNGGLIPDFTQIARTFIEALRTTGLSAGKHDGQCQAFFTESAHRFGLGEFVAEVDWDSLFHLNHAGDNYLSPDLIRSQSPIDWFGEDYNNNLSEQVRKESGIVYTPQWLARKMVLDALAINKTPMKMLDPCCGTGIFLLELICALHLQKRANFITELLNLISGRDQDQIACFFAALNIFIYAALIEPNSINELASRPSLLKITAESFLRTDSRCGMGDSESEAYDLIIGNPPYVFLRNLSPIEKDSFRGRYKTTSKQFDTYGIFVEQALAALATGGLLSFVVPDSILTLQNRLETRKILLEQCHLVKLSYVGDVFPGAVVSSVVLLAQKINSNEDLAGAFVQVEDIQQIYDPEIHIIPQEQFISDDFSLGAAVRGTNASIVPLLKKYAWNIREYNAIFPTNEKVNLGRGVEIGKKGLVSRCPDCQIHYPTPKNNICPICGAILESPWSIFLEETMLAEPNNTNMPMVLGLRRWQCTRVAAVVRGIAGIKYKNQTLYSEQRVIIRQLLQQRRLCAALPPLGALTTQSVYNLNVPPSVDPREILGVVNSEIVATFAHQVFSGGKKLFPRVLLHVINDLPLFPRKLLSTKNSKVLCRIVEQFLEDPARDTDSTLQDLLNEAVLDYFSCGGEDRTQVLRAVSQFRAEVLKHETSKTPYQV